MGQCLLKWLWPSPRCPCRNKWVALSKEQRLLGRGYCRRDGAAAAGSASSGLSTACELMWIPWHKANTWILWKPQESSPEMVNIPEKPLSIRKPGYWRKGVTRLSGVSSGGSMAARGRCCEAQRSNSRANPLCPTGKSPQAAATWAFCKNICVLAQFCCFFFSNLFFKFSVNLNDTFLMV